ncbi:MAG: dockerin type I domain-containing protein [Bacteroidales bacterium]|nr:dockerin type I domain-containing protein [Bacteroidales bacterium]
MKKGLLFLAAAVALASTANAQVVERAKQAKKVNKVTNMQRAAFDLNNACMKVGQMATSMSQIKKAPAAKAAPQAFYARPNGAFYVNWDQNGSGFIRPMVYGKPFSTYTYTNLSTGADSWMWEYTKHNQGAMDTLTADTKDLTVTYGYEFAYAPTLVASGSGSSAEYVIGGGKQGGPIYVSPLFFTQYPNEPMAETAEDLTIDLLASPHYYGSSDRYCQEQYGWGYYSGAKGSPDDTEGTGYWFGKNYSGWDMQAVAFEAPEKPYVLNNVYLYYTALKVVAGAEAPVKVTVYRLPEMLPYIDGSRNTIGEAVMNEENVIAEGTIVLNDQTPAGGILQIPLVTVEDDFEFEVTPEIDSAILIVVKGFGGENILSSSLLVTNDDYDEGKGELAFLGNIEDNVLQGLNNFFRSGEMKVGMSIFIGNNNPFMVFNYNLEDGKYEFPVEGGVLTRTFTGQPQEFISFYSSSSSEEWDVTVNGEELPEWLTVELEDQMADGEFTGVVNARVVAAALPEGEQYREAVVKFHILGDYINCEFTQGTKPAGKKGDVNGDGEVNVSDVTALVNKILGTAEYADAVCDINEDGEVNVSDVTALINLILG